MYFRLILDNTYNLWDDTAYCLISHCGVMGIEGCSGYFYLNLFDNSVMRGRVNTRRTLKGLVAGLRIIIKLMFIKT